MHPATRKYADHVNPAFVKLLGTFGYGRVLVRAKGTRCWDDEGREYLDFLAGFGAINLGHNHPRLIERVQAALGEDLVSVVHTGPQQWAGEFAAALAQRVPELPMSLLALSGGEAVESALKLARAATGRDGFVFCKGGYHGTGFGSLSVMGFRRFRDPFQPLLGGCVEIPFGDLGALEKALRAKPAAFLVEPIQAEAGVTMPPAGYFAEAARLCRKAGTLLVLDEVQTGMGRTGALFAFRHEPSFVPDVLVLGKSLGGSLVPVSVAMTTRELQKRAYGTTERFDLHGSTFSGYALGCRAAMETLALLEEEGLCDRANELGAQALEVLRARLGKHPLVREVRGRGLLIGIELGPTKTGLWAKLAETLSREVLGQWLALRLLEQGILCQPASQQWNVLRLEPPLTVTREEIDRVVDAIDGVLREYESLGPLMADVSKRIGAQAMSGWEFR